MSFIRKNILKYLKTTGWSHFVSLFKFSYRMGKLGIITMFENRSEILKIFHNDNFFSIAKSSLHLTKFGIESLWDYRKELLNLAIFFSKNGALFLYFF